MYILRNIKNANHIRFLSNLKKVAKNEQTTFFKLLIDYFFCLIKYRFTFNDYLNYQIYKKNKQERSEYVSCQEQDVFYEIVSPSAYKKVFTIKPNFLKAFSKYAKREFLVINHNYEDFLTYINKKPCFFVKPQDGLGGAGVRKVITKEIKDVKAFYQELEKEKAFIEEAIIQHPKMNKLAAKSVNTIRVVTSNINNQPEILIAVLRVGNGINQVDNFHQGGMGCLVDQETGIVLTGAYDKDNNYYDEHPFSKEKFVGYQIPYWDKVKKLVIEASRVEPRIKVVGWDVAIKKDGPILIEGNRRPGFDLIQVVCKRGRRDIINKVLSEINKGKS